MPSTASTTTIAVRLDRSSESRLGRDGAKCWTTRKAMPLKGAIAPSNSEIASRPPADAPIPTMVKDAADSSFSMAMVVTVAPVTQCSHLKFAGASGDAEQKTKLTFKHCCLKAKELIR